MGRNFRIQKQKKSQSKADIVCNKLSNAYKAHKISQDNSNTSVNKMVRGERREAEREKEREAVHISGTEKTL